LARLTPGLFLSRFVENRPLLIVVKSEIAKQSGERPTHTKHSQHQPETRDRYTGGNKIER